MTELCDGRALGRGNRRTTIASLGFGQGGGACGLFRGAGPLLFHPETQVFDHGVAEALAGEAGHDGGAAGRGRGRSVAENLIEIFRAGGGESPGEFGDVPGAILEVSGTGAVRAMAMKAGEPPDPGAVLRVGRGGKAQAAGRIGRNLSKSAGQGKAVTGLQLPDQGGMPGRVESCGLQRRYLVRGKIEIPEAPLQ